MTAKTRSPMVRFIIRTYTRHYIWFTNYLGAVIEMRRQTVFIKPNEVDFRMFSFLYILPLAFVQLSPPKWKVYHSLKNHLQYFEHDGIAPIQVPASG